MIKLDPPYVALLQKPSVCAAACLQMVLLRRGYGLRDQETVAEALGIKVNARWSGAFREGTPLLAGPTDSLGLDTVRSEVAINRALRELGTDLTARSLPYAAMRSPAEEIAEALAADRDVWVEYHAQDIHAGDAMGGAYSHDGLIESLDDQGRVTILDPLPDHRQRLTLSLADLDDAISGRRHGKPLGFIVVDRSA